MMMFPSLPTTLLASALAAGSPVGANVPAVPVLPGLALTGACAPPAGILSNASYTTDADAEAPAAECAQALGSMTVTRKLPQRSDWHHT